MGQSYYTVTQALAEPVKVFGRGDHSATEFEAATGQPVIRGDLDLILEKQVAPERAIVAVSIDSLAQVASTLIRAGTKRLLLEKPGALNRFQLAALNGMAAAHGATVVIGYNRRFHAATLAAEKMIAEDGGATSCVFEFTEWANTITPLALPIETKQNWMYANSSHVSDLAFYLSGLPAQMATYHGGGLNWHSRAARFVGAGVTDRGVFFSYHADWEAPGRWGVEVMTRKRRFIFRPMEKLQVMPLASTVVEMAELDYSLDQSYKPGLFLQTQAFLAGEDHRFCTLAQQEKNFEFYGTMAGYSE
jgi:predicted dehydrogenase